MNKILVVDKVVKEVGGCWNCKKSLARPKIKSWRTLAENLEAAGWKAHLSLDFFNQQGQVVEYYKVWCPDCEEGSGPTESVDTRAFELGCWAVVVVLATLVLATLALVAWWVL